MTAIAFINRREVIEKAPHTRHPPTLDVLSDGQTVVYDITAECQPWTTTFRPAVRAPGSARRWDWGAWNGIDPPSPEP